MSGLVGGAGSKSGFVSDRLDIYAHLNNSSTTYGAMTFADLEGDSTNITQDGDAVTLEKSGIYYITCSFTFTLNGNERFCLGKIMSVSGSRGTDTLAICYDEVVQTDSATSYGNAAAFFTGIFVAGDTIDFSFTSGSGANVTLRSESHASIIRMSR